MMSYVSARVQLDSRIKANWTDHCLTDCHQYGALPLQVQERAPRLLTSLLCALTHNAKSLPPKKIRPPKFARARKRNHLYVFSARPSRPALLNRAFQTCHSLIRKAFCHRQDYSNPTNHGAWTDWHQSNSMPCERNFLSNSALVAKDETRRSRRIANKQRRTLFFLRHPSISLSNTLAFGLVELRKPLGSDGRFFA